MNYFGTIRLDAQEAKGVRDLVTRLGGDTYVSRNRGFYACDNQTTEALSKRRQQLGERLTDTTGKPAFVIAETMASLSAKVTYAEYIKHLRGKRNGFDQASACLDEDIKNIVGLLHGKMATPPPTQHVLPRNKDAVPQRSVKTDNMGLLDAVGAALPPHGTILTPGMGGMFIGPFAKAHHGSDYKIIDFSGYAKEDFGVVTKRRLKDIMHAKDIARLGDNLILMDGDAMTGETLNTLRGILQREGITPKLGACKINWDNAYIQNTAAREMDFASALDFIPAPPFKVEAHDFGALAWERNKMARGIKTTESEVLSQFAYGQNTIDAKKIELKKSSIDFNARLKANLTSQSSVPSPQ